MMVPVDTPAAQLRRQVAALEEQVQDLEERNDLYEEVMLDMFGYIKDMNSPCIRTRFDATDHFRNALLELGFEV